MNAWLPPLNRVLFKLFVLAIFFLYYETKFISGTVHTWLMLVGLILTIPIIGKRYGDQLRIPFDYFLILILTVITMLGFVANYPTTVWRDFQAYILMFATYIYVRENTPADGIEFLSFVVKAFLLVNGLFVIAQLLTGQFYPARLLAAGDPPLLIASGVSDGPTKNGMLISFALSFMYARLVFKRIALSLFDCLVFLLGTASLLAATSRAGLLSFAAVLVFGAVFAIFMATREKQYKLSILSVAMYASVFGIVMATIVHQGFDYEILFTYRDPNVDRYGVDTMMYKLMVFDDGSTEERFGTAAFFTKELFESPLQFFSVGFGTGTFETMYGLNVHNSYLELAFTTGLVGFAMFVWLTLHIIRKALSQPNSIKIVPLIFALASISAFMAAHDVLRGRLFWLALGIIGAFAYSSARREVLVAVSRPSTNESSARYHWS